MKKLYTAPLLTVVAINVERGYALSLSTNTEAVSELLNDGHHDYSEARGVSTGWSKEGEDDFWGDNTYSL